MKKLFSLFKILFNSWYGISVFKDKVSKNKTEIFKLLGLFIIIIISVAPILVGYIAFMVTYYNTFVMMGQPGIIITMGVVSASVVVLLFGFLFVISTFYFSNDTEHLVSLPLKPSTILGAKLGVILTAEYITEFPLVLPPIIIYGMKSGAGILYWIYSVIGLLIIPIIPLCLTSIIAVVIMRLTNIGKKKDLYRTIGGIIGIILILGVQMLIQSAATSGDMEKIQAMLFSENGFINAVARNFPPAKWISMALINYNTLNGFLMFILFAATTVIFIAAFMFFGEKLFLGGFLGSRETEAKRKRIDEGKLESEVEVKSKVWAIFWREFRILNRVPIFFMNCVLVVILIPAIFLIMPLASGNESSRAISELINGSQSIYIATIVVVGISIFTSIANMTASTSLSREGSEFFVSKYIPVSPSEQIMGKFIHAFMLDAAGNLLTAIAILYILRLNIAYIFIIFVISSLAAIPITAIALMIDMFRPYLNWDNPTKAVKQNLNGVVAMFFNALWNGILLFAAGNLIQNPAIGYVVLIVVYAALGFGLYKALLTYAEKRYAQIEA